MAHYQHKKHDPKTGRFAKIKSLPQETPGDPQAPAIESPAEAQERAERRLRAAQEETEEWERLTVAEQRQKARRERHEANTLLLRAEREREAREAKRPDWVNDPRSYGQPGGDGDGGFGMF
jgi:hypothetical protein